ncbi:hypothetical protein [Burkholderia cepacia]|uniref:hypothetical protein n=1 Tax=Burkholderia cepacia TaxID=292 RepID=UPI002019F50E|nr:hypothetical protein [Burkholderia cepacia]UQO33019.1 hypothetical protein L0Z22_10870 [Burkholderia cepacia]UQO46514.1 hypothetical protein L0Z05_12670 [Burkholderia cepacia]UQP11594.1 hypothetical protein L0Z01_26430 [Burkholderia cepacia]
MSLAQSSATPRRRKRVPPPNFAYQLALGRPGEGVVNSAWDALRNTNNTSLLPPYQFHFEPVWNILNVVRRLEAFLHVCHGDVEPFVLHPDALGRLSIVARWPARAVAELFTSNYSRELRRISAVYPEHRFHPLFQIFLEADPEHLENRRVAGQTQLEIACNNYISVFSKPTKLNQHAQIEALGALNELSKTILGHARSLSEEIKQFRRAAQDTRTSAMQYAHHLITRAPNLFFAHFTLHRSPLEADNGPVTYLEIRKIREKFKRTLKKDILESNYLGYSIFLRHNVKIGYWLDAFVYLSDSLGLASDTVYEIAQKWNSHVGAKRAEINYVAWPVPAGNEEVVARTLESMTMATEPDFCCRTIPPNGDHAFWCSQSPVGKLAKRTRIRKKTARNAAHQARASGDKFVRELQAEEIIRQQELAFAAWDAASQRKKKTLATRQAKAQKTRLRKNNQGDSTS